MTNSNASYYLVNVFVSRVNDIDYVEHIPFKSPYAAKYMAAKYYECVDVTAVEIIDQTTGEIVYIQDSINGEYDNIRGQF